MILSEGALEELFDQLAQRRQEAIHCGWRDIPEWVFCSSAGTPIEARNFNRVWDRLRRRAQKHGIRKLKLHATRHTWATLALEAGKNIRWVADQLGHADPAMTLRVYAHAMKRDEQDLSFVEFGVAKPRSTSLARLPENDESPNPLESLVGRGGLEPPTLGLKDRKKPNK